MQLVNGPMFVGLPSHSLLAGREAENRPRETVAANQGSSQPNVTSTTANPKLKQPHDVIEQAPAPTIVTPTANRLAAQSEDITAQGASHFPTAPAVQKKKHKCKSNPPTDGRSHINPLLAAVIYPLNTLLHYLWFKVEIRGRENLPKTGRVIYSLSHQSLDDGPAVSLLRRGFRFMTDEREFYCLQGAIMRNLGAFPTSKRNAGPQVFEHCRELLRSGTGFVICPEGEIYQDRQVHRFMSGVGRIATSPDSVSGAPFSADMVVPITMDFAGYSFRSKLTIEVGKPLWVAKYVIQYGDQADEQLVRDLYNIQSQTKASITGIPAVPWDVRQTEPRPN